MLRMLNFDIVDICWVLCRGGGSLMLDVANIKF
jgi:hypothetical protein